jgi:nitrate/TMAO reductase-like tetraheme cytochrome c subunit
MASKSPWLKNFFFPPADRPVGLKILPYAVVVLILILLLVGLSAGWETTNTTSFCGLTCHTMPPQYVTHSISSHSRVTCEECHLGRASLIVQIPRKIKYSWQTGSSLVLNTYEYPIRAKSMRPALEACETCHYPQTFTGDKLLQINKYADDQNNTFSEVNLLLKTGGGSKRQGLGNGIHWHIENPVFFLAEDADRQNIPYVRVTLEDGSIKEYIDIQSSYKAGDVKAENLIQMDCNTCHNRTSHPILPPATAMDQMLARGLISPSIPEIKKKGEEILKNIYASEDEANQAISGLDKFYKDIYPDFYKENSDLISNATLALKNQIDVSVFYDQKMNWSTHADNIGHETAPGCFRCHDGKHLTTDNEAIRLECNLCHSIPVVSKAEDLVANIEINRSVEPPSHLNTNWITMHNQVFDTTCQSCHSVENPGGTDNSSFCSNSACHGSSWPYAGFDAPLLREAIKDQLPVAPPTAVPVSTVAPGADVTYITNIDPILKGKCSACHGESGTAGLTLTSYAGIMKGSKDGPVVIPGNADASPIVVIQKTGHPVVLTIDELDLLIAWINAGATQ